MGVGLHIVATTRREVLDVAQAERTTTVLVALEFRNSSLGSVGVVESDHTSSARPAARFVLNLGLLDLANSLEKFDQIVVACRPGKLSRGVSQPKIVDTGS